MAFVTPSETIVLISFNSCAFGSSGAIKPIMTSLAKLSLILFAFHYSYYAIPLITDSRCESSLITLIICESPDNSNTFATNGFIPITMTDPLIAFN